MSLTLVIGTKRFSSWSLRPWYAMKVAGIAFDEAIIELRQPETKTEILKWSPSGKVPLLIDGAVKVWDSLAIGEYLAERFPAAGLWPDAPETRAVARAVAAEMHSGFMPTRQVCYMDLQSDTPLIYIPVDVAPDLARLDAIMSDCRTRFGAGGPFLFGRFSYADAMYSALATRVRTYRLPLGPVAAAYCDTLLAQPAMAEWIKGAAEPPEGR